MNNGLVYMNNGLVYKKKNTHTHTQKLTKAVYIFAAQFRDIQNFMTRSISKWFYDIKKIKNETHSAAQFRGVRGAWNYRPLFWALSRKLFKRLYATNKTVAVVSLDNMCLIKNTNSKIQKPPMCQKSKRVEYFSER